MCGIAGIILEYGDQARAEEQQPRLRSMLEAMRHRGPDDTGMEFVAGAGLAFARLAIIDLEGGHQPMRSPCGRYTIVFNGEVYNFRELRKELEAAGRVFGTRSDTEVLLAMYEAHGEGMLEHLNGMFAFMIHDRETGELFGARDRLGIKPLFYAVTPGGFLFASELTSIRAAGLAGTDMSPAAFSEYLSYGFICAPRTIYDGVAALPPGCSIRFRRGEVETRRYWRVRRSTDGPQTLDDAVERLEGLLQDAASMRTVADVPLGALLSGGIDSGLITALLARGSGSRLRTFSVGFEDDELNELPWAKRVAEMYGTEHTEIICRPRVRGLVEKLAVAYGQPFGDSSAIPSYMVCQEARRHVTVALSGDGGDEVFAGYRRYGSALREPSSPLRVAYGLAHGLLGRMLPVTARGLRRLRRAGLSARERQVDALVQLPDHYKRWLAGDRLAPALGASSLAVAREAGGDFEEEGGLRRFQHQDLEVYLPNDILEKMDRASMLNSLEVRVPILDHRVVEFGLNLPVLLKHDGVHGKLLLRELARGLLPKGHLEKPKTGFSIPRDRWLRGELRELVNDTLLSSQLALDGWLAQAPLTGLVRSHMAGRSVANALWVLMMAELWYREAQRT